MRKGLLILLPALLLAQSPDDKAVGKKQFQQTCGFCHGSDGRGSSGPDLIRSAILGHDVGGDLIGQVVRNGRPEKGMPAFQLSDSQIRNIADFLHAEAKVAASVARRIPNEYPLEKLLVGDAAAGKTFFNGQGGCNGCHSPSGDLAHIASKYAPFNLQTRIAFPEGIKPIVHVVDPEGNKFSGEQVYADEFLVSLRDKDGVIRTWKRTLAQIEIIDPLAGHERLLRIYTDNNIHDLFAYLETLK